MGRVTFRDAHRVEWQVGEVIPDRIAAVRARHGSPRAAVTPGRSRPVLPGLERGWLFFESWWEKRRLPAPYPADWETLAPAELERLCARATIVPPRLEDDASLAGPRVVGREDSPR